ncbi:ABC transporter ATP-binding protein [Enemella dayhoffiae]|uniref:ABC-type quaternary amine transporter n=1 Tax=Enemella dayhoffiae TaxID=2016507 RepID=A0A255HCM7_9ACTN|nr:ABC transporter ATP-binding protein [Enemella dayhoffiae]OYO24946.1 ABC transporter ATP-binding protein [Enemella dayhoffiae]
MDLVLRGVTKAYADTPVLRGIDLDIPAGRATAIVGASGSGKTTLLRIIAGFLSADTGSVLADGADLLRLPVHRRGIGYVPQEGALLPHLTVAGNIGFGLSRAERRSGQRVAELMELVSLAPALRDRHPAQLSGGQQQRVALARALARRPGVVLLDEPFSSLDAGLRHQTRSALGEVLRSERVTTVLVTHDQDEALSFADQVAVLDAGKLAQVADPVSLYTRPDNRATALFLGDAVLLPGTAAGAGAIHTCLGELVCVGPEPAPGASAEVLIRPEQLRVDAAGPLRARVLRTDYFGHDVIAHLDVDGVPITMRHHDAADLVAGTEISFRVAGPVVLLDPARHELPAP